MNQPNQPPKCNNCGENIGTDCACVRNTCMRCGKSVGNITFTVCDECWNTPSAEPPQPPKSADITKDELVQLMYDVSDKVKTIEGYTITAIWEDQADAVLKLINSRSPRYVTDKEIDAMWPITQGYEDENKAAKAMRDMIFNNVKPK